MTNLWTIKDADGNVTNQCIKGTEEFVAANFEYYAEFSQPVRAAPTDAEEARRWRSEELLATDYIVPLSDHPSRTATMTYRAALRDWPSTSDFPGTQPKLGE